MLIGSSKDMCNLKCSDSHCDCVTEPLSSAIQCLQGSATAAAAAALVKHELYSQSFLCAALLGVIKGSVVHCKEQSISGRKVLFETHLVTSKHNMVKNDRPDQGSRPSAPCL